MSTVRIDGDGLCMFRSICEGLARVLAGRELGAAEQHRVAVSLRDLTVEWLAAKPRLLRLACLEGDVASPEAYLRGLRHGTLLPGEAELAVIARNVPVCIHVHQVGQRPKTYDCCGNDKRGRRRRPIVNLAYAHNHYDLLW